MEEDQPPNKTPRDKSPVPPTESSVPHLEEPDLVLDVPLNTTMSATSQSNASQVSRPSNLISSRFNAPAEERRILTARRSIKPSNTGTLAVPKTPPSKVIPKRRQPDVASSLRASRESRSCSLFSPESTGMSTSTGAREANLSKLKSPKGNASRRILSASAAILKSWSLPSTSESSPPDLMQEAEILEESEVLEEPSLSHGIHPVGDTEMGDVTEDQFQRLERLGEGTYGAVYKAINKATGEFVVLKTRYLLDKGGEEVSLKTIQEISVLRELKHPNIVSLIDDMVEGDYKAYLAFECCPTNLKTFLDKSEGTPMEEATARWFGYQMFLAVAFCHSRQILHCNLKPQNVFIFPETWLLKIGDIDFTLRSRSLYSLDNLYYLPPDVLLGAEIGSKAVDVWSLGCILGELFTKKPIFRGLDEMDQIRCIFQILTTPTEDTWPGVTELEGYERSFPQWSEDRLLEHTNALIPEDIFDLFRKTLLYNPRNRIECDQALEHYCFDSLENRRLGRMMEI